MRDVVFSASRTVSETLGVFMLFYAARYSLDSITIIFVCSSLEVKHLLIEFFDEQFYFSNAAMQQNKAKVASKPELTTRLSCSPGDWNLEGGQRERGKAAITGGG
ncbi:MAG: hypothetical protein KIT18_07600 [Burkholderiales bacterium]|nr:hypothetical protein [Burkholderiales bacterium]